LSWRWLRPESNAEVGQQACPFFVGRRTPVWAFTILSRLATRIVHANPCKNTGKMTRMSDGRRASFVIPVVRDRRGQISGVIERAATGANDGTRARLGLQPVTLARNRPEFGASLDTAARTPVASRARIRRHLLYAPLEIKGDAEVHALSRCQMILTEASKLAQREFEEALDATGLTVSAVRDHLDAHPAMEWAPCY
jgi:hypothetical protein